MKTKSILLLLVLLCQLPALAQKRFAAQPANPATSGAILDKMFTHYAVFDLNTADLAAYVTGKGSTSSFFTLVLPGYTELPLSVYPYDILSSTYTLTEATAEGRHTYTKPACITYRGSLTHEDGSQAWLTIAPDLLYGYIGGSTPYFIEPLRYFDRHAPANSYVVYEPRHVIPRPGVSCGVTETQNKAAELNKTYGTATGTCRLVEVAVASIDSMYIRYGTAAAVQQHNIAVMNTVVGIYADAQIGTQYLEFKIAGQYVSTTAVTNPMLPNYSGINGGIMLDNFASWGQAGNFGFTYDLGQMWTSRDFGTVATIVPPDTTYSMSVIGLAYVGTLCTNSRYQLLEDFSSNGLSLGSMVSHEIGHNLNAQHDASGAPYIMAPSISSPPNTAFSPTSITAINSYISGSGGSCLSACGTITPVAQFSLSANNTCTGNSITVSDRSVGAVTGISWSFPGGSPASSTDSVLAVTYATPGLKTISLTATNGLGNNSLSRNVFVGNALSASTCISNVAGNGQSGILLNFRLADAAFSSGTAFINGNYNNISCTNNTVLLPSTTYSVNVRLGFQQLPTYDIFNKIQLFIDYNNDGDFLDANEAVYTSASCIQGNFVFSFTTPSSISAGNTWLRMRAMGLPCGLANSDGCAIPANSTVQDYAVYFAASAALPLTLQRFEGYHINGRNELMWQTADGKNTGNFVVERSTNAAAFEAIANVRSLSTPGTHTYRLTDALEGMEKIGRFYYRLRMTDEDGSYTYSQVVTINKPVSSTPAISLYPNPVVSGGQVQIIAEEPASLQVHNSLGQLMSLPVNTVIHTGTNQLSLPANWPAGIYFIRLSTSQGTFTQSLVIQ